MEAAPSSIVAKLTPLIAQRESLKRLLRSRGRDAQELLDLFQWLLDQPTLDEQLRKHVIVSAQRISVKTGLYPACHELKDRIEDTMQAGAGGQADIYKGRYQGRYVCIKVMRVFETMDQELVLKHFWREAILWRQMSHPNVVPMFGLYRFQERPCIVAPWLENGNINKYLKHHSEAPRLPLVVGVARGLCYLHSRGIVHGDLKGSNVLVDDQGMARVADFGISSISDPQILTLTSHSGFASNGGTVRWQAPELITMHDDMAVSNNKPSDIYAWACVCYEIFTGRIPLDHLANDAAVVYHVAFKGTRPSRPSNSSPSWTSWGLTTEIWSIMEDCWKAEPTDRPTISSVLRRLRSSAIDSEVDMQFSPRHFRALMNKTLTNSRILSTRVLDEIALHHNALTGSALWRKKLQSSQTNYHNPSTSASLDFSQATSLVNGTHGRYSDERATSSNMRHLITRLCAIFDDNIQYKQLLDGHGTKAQTLLDVFQTLLDLSEITSDFKRNVTVAAQELSKRSGLLPKCYILEDLKIDDVSGAFFTREGLSGYHRGDYLGRTVSLKALRSHQGTTNGQLPKEISTDLIILWSQLSHTNLLPVFGLYQFQSCIYLVSPWMENGHILEFLQTNSHTNRALLLLDVATGIAYLHDNNIVHGELKGINVLVDECGRARLAHFGFISTIVTNEWSTSTDSMIRWRSPELLRITGTLGRSETKASDIYAFACVAYEVFTHNCPFHEIDDDISVTARVTSGEHPSRPCHSSHAWGIRGLTKDLWALMESCWSFSSSRRPKIHDIVSFLHSEIQVDDRPMDLVLTPSSFRHLVSGRPKFPSLINIDLMLLS